jgi:hypothetical protein
MRINQSMAASTIMSKIFVPIIPPLQIHRISACAWKKMRPVAEKINPPTPLISKVAKDPLVGEEYGVVGRFPPSPEDI